MFRGSLTYLKLEPELGRGGELGSWGAGELGSWGAGEAAAASLSTCGLPHVVVGGRPLVWKPLGPLRTELTFSGPAVRPMASPAVRGSQAALSVDVGTELHRVHLFRASCEAVGPWGRGALGPAGRPWGRLVPRWGGEGSQFS